MDPDHNLYRFDEVEKDGTDWLHGILNRISLQSVGAVSYQCFTNRNGMTKELLAKFLTDAMLLVNRQNKLIGNLRLQSQQLKTEVIGCQGSVINLQKELLAAKDQQLSALQTAVVTSVEDTVKTELKSYSEAAQSLRSAEAPFTQETLKTVVKHVVAEEDRSRNVMVFGLPEDSDEQLCENVSDVFQQLGVKPRIEASRLGKKSSSTKRPVKVTLSSSSIVQQILAKARNLRQSENYKSIFISPDRSVEQRAQQKQLVLDLKEKCQLEPSRRHYISGGQIRSVDIPGK